jgi:hypothetical protein
MRNVGNCLGTVLAGMCLPVLESVGAYAAIPVLALLDRFGVLQGIDSSVMWFFWMTPILLLGLTLGYERHGSGTWRWAILLGLGLVIGAPVLAWLLTESAEPDWLRNEYLPLLWNSLAGAATLFAGTWLGGLVARRRVALARAELALPAGRS